MVLVNSTDYVDPYWTDLEIALQKKSFEFWRYNITRWNGSVIFNQIFLLYLFQPRKLYVLEIIFKCSFVQCELLVQNLELSSTIQSLIAWSKDRYRFINLSFSFSSSFIFSLSLSSKYKSLPFFFFPPIIHS